MSAHKLQGAIVPPLPEKSLVGRFEYVPKTCSTDLGTWVPVRHAPMTFLSMHPPMARPSL